MAESIIDLDVDPLDYLLLGSAQSPGTVVLSGHDRVKDWNVAAAKGQTGASSSLNGDPIGKFQAEFYLADDEDLAGWEDFQRLIESTTNGPTPVALPIYHPDLARNKFTEVVNGGIGGMLHDGRGGRIVQVTFLEYRPPKPKPSAKAKAKPAQTYANTDEGGRSPPPEDPNAAAKRELAGLVDEARRP
jgi:hypothetical protein